MRACAEQQVDDLDVIALHRPVQRRGAVHLRRVDIALLPQQHADGPALSPAFAASIRLAPPPAATPHIAASGINADSRNPPRCIHSFSRVGPTSHARQWSGAVAHDVRLDADLVQQRDTKIHHPGVDWILEVTVSLELTASPADEHDRQIVRAVDVADAHSAAIQQDGVA